MCGSLAATFKLMLMSRDVCWLKSVLLDGFAYAAEAPCTSTSVGTIKLMLTNRDEWLAV